MKINSRVSTSVPLASQEVYKLPCVMCYNIRIIHSHRIHGTGIFTIIYLHLASFGLDLR